MPDFLTSGSAIERTLLCAASAALPHFRYTTEFTERGTAVHSFLEACAAVGRDAALVQCDPEYYSLCDALDLTGLDLHFNMAAEVAFAFDVETGIARELGRGVGRAYDDVGINEIPATLDVVGVRDLPDGTRRGFYCDYKSGARNFKAIASTTQIDFGALCVARAYGCDLVEGQLANVREDLPPFVQRRVLEGFELDMFAEDLREHLRTWKSLRDEYQRTGKLATSSYLVGAWCDQCGARENCAAQTGLVRSVLDAPPALDGIPDEMIGALWERIAVAQSALSTVKKRILGIAGSRPIALGSRKPGTERWLTAVVSEGRASLDGETVFDAIAELHSEEVATAATTIETTKKQIGEAIGAIAPRGKKAALLRDLYAKLAKTPGAITKKPGVKIAELELPSGEQPRLMSRRDDAPDDDSST